MLTIETVNIKDVRPLKDEYGNKVLCRDYELKENKLYIKQLADNIKAKGVPEEPIVLIRDKGAYRIKAGNTRVEAMKLNGVTHFEAVIDEDTTPEDLLELAASVYRTDLKKQFEPTEKARVGQQLFMLDPDDLSLSETIGEPVDTIKKRRRGFEIARAKAGDETTQLTMAHFELIDEFGDEEGAFDRIISAEEHELEWISRDYRDKRKDRERGVKIIEALKERGIEIVNNPSRNDYNYFDYVSKPTQVRTLDLGNLLPGDLVATNTGYPAEFSLYIKKEAAEAGRARTESELINDQRKAKMERAKEARLEFLKNHYPDLPAIETLAKSDPDRFDPINWVTRSFINDHDFCVEIPRELFILEVFRQRVGYLLDYKGEIHDLVYAKKFIEFAEALVKDGYIPPEAELELIEEVQSYIDANQVATEAE